MKDISKSNKTGFLSILTAISASMCCITPILAIVAGSGGMATMFSWMEPFRPYLIGLTVIILSFAWYHKLTPNDDIDCSCDRTKKSYFWQSKNFLLIITLFAASILAFPYYSNMFYDNSPEESLVLSGNNIIKETFEVKGMTCSGCEAPIENEVNKLSGVIWVQASYENANTTVEFDNTKITESKIIETINKTGYKAVISNKETNNSK